MWPVRTAEVRLNSERIAILSRLTFRLSNDAVTTAQVTYSLMQCDYNKEL